MIRPYVTIDKKPPTLPFATLPGTNQQKRRNTMYTSFIDSPLGILQLVCQDDAVTELNFLDENRPAELASSPSAQERSIAAEASRQLAEYFAGQRTHFTVKCRPAGTPFQQKVWQSLQEIPYGTTCAYSDIATKIGSPNACRAVGGANRINPIPIIIPCHRVIGKNGNLVGFSAGIDKKILLLELEGVLLSGHLRGR